MPQQPEQLAPTQDVPAHPIASMRHYRGDIALLNYLLQDLRALIRRHDKDEIAIHPHQVFTWDVSKATIRLGLGYVGLLDELAIFNRTLSTDEVQSLYELPTGLSGLLSYRK